MSTDFPPLPRVGDARAPLAEGTLSSQGSSESAPPSKASGPDVQSATKAPKVICHDGDLIIEYTELSSGVNHCWRVDSDSLRRNSPYFQALLDPLKFAEGRLLAQHKQKQLAESKPAPSPQTAVDSNEDRPEGLDLPTVKLVESPIIKLCGVDAIDAFLKILCLDAQDQETRAVAENDLRNMPISLLERTIEIAEDLNSPTFVNDTLRRVVHGEGGGSKRTNARFNPNEWKWNEDRVRQKIIIALKLGETQTAQVLTHTLVVTGSRNWVNKPEKLSTPHLRWQYLPHGIEEELYDRRQYVLNTITDLQAYFLRIYGALEPLPEPKSARLSMPPKQGAAFSASNKSSPYQCRAGLENGSQCDLYQLGQMIRFFALRAKTVFLGSTLIDPDFEPDDTGAEDEVVDPVPKPADPSNPTSAITVLLDSLRKCPDYAIDPNHQSCGVRRRFVPALGSIEKFVRDSRGLLGINIARWIENSQSRQSMAWRRGWREPYVDIHWDNIVSSHSRAVRSPHLATQADDAKLFFTARKRNWEAGS